MKYLLTSALLAAFAHATPVINSKINVDGSTSDWSTCDDSNSVPLYKLGESSTPAATACMSVECGTDRMCLRVIAEDGNAISDSNIWVSVSGSRTSYKPTDLELIQDASGSTVGWEGCFAVPAVDSRSTGLASSDGDVQVTSARADDIQTTSASVPSSGGTPTRVRSGYRSRHLSAVQFRIQSGSYSASGASMDISCTESGGGYGDPHLKTWLGQTYDFHGQCDMVLVRSPTFGSGLGMEIQIRTEIRRDWSFISEAAIMIGKDILEVGSQGLYRINGGVTTQEEKSKKLPELSGFPIQYTKYGTKRHKFEIDLGNEGKVAVKIFNEFLAVAVDGDVADFGDSVGLMGDFYTGEFAMRWNTDTQSS